MYSATYLVRCEDTTKVRTTEGGASGEREWPTSPLVVRLQCWGHRWTPSESTMIPIEPGVQEAQKARRSRIEHFSLPAERTNTIEYDDRPLFIWTRLFQVAISLRCQLLEEQPPRLFVFRFSCNLLIRKCKARGTLPSKNLHQRQQEHCRARIYISATGTLPSKNLHLRRR